jgi:dolichol-phosphate mannosyltransferase
MSPLDLARRVHIGLRRPSNWVQLVKFGAVGVSGYVVNLAVFALLVKTVDVHYIGAAVLAFCVAVTNNFIWNRQWTFRAIGGHPGFQAARFLAVSLGALGINLIALEVLVSAAELPEVASQALAVGIAMPFNFLGNKFWTFPHHQRVPMGTREP